MSDKELVKTESRSNWNVVLASLAAAAIVMLPEMSAAMVSSAGNVEGVLCGIVTLLTGTLGKAIATLAIIIIGIGALMGKVSWGMAIIVALGVGIVFGAGTIVNNLSGTTAGCSTAISVGTLR